MRFGLAGRFTLTITLILAGGLGLVTYLNFAKFHKTLAELEASRFAVTGAEIVSTIENSLNLGLALEEIENLAQVLGDAKSLDHAILAIEVRGLADDILIGTSPKNLDTLLALGVPPESTQNEASLGDEDPAGLFLQLPIMNSFGETAGHLVLSYSDEDFRTATAAVWQELRVVLIQAWMLAAVIATPLVFLTCYDFAQKLRQLSAALDRPNCGDEHDASRAAMLDEWTDEEGASSARSSAPVVAMGVGSC